MQWIDEAALAAWAKRNDARALLADMISDLVRATIKDFNRFRFPGGDSAQLRGWDGFLETGDANSRVPSGKSKWEFSVGAGATKASKDYEKRTAETSPEVMRENALVLVNLERWDTPRSELTKWEQDRRDEGHWRDVRYIDAVELVHWLDEHPAVAAIHAREVLRSAPKEGALSTDEFWEIYSRQFEPQLTEQVVVADRQAMVDELVAKLAGPAQSVILGAELAEEVIAFAVAAIRVAKPEVRRAIEVKTLIVDTEAAARFLSQREGMTFIATRGAEAMVGVLSAQGPTLSAATGAHARKYPMLVRPSASSMAEALTTMGFDREEGFELAHRCGRSLTILRRLRPKGPVPEPTWVANALALKPALLAGGWSDRTEYDRQILKKLSGLPEYANLQSVLVPTLAVPDPPLDRLAEYWMVRAPVDAFSYYGRLLVDVDLQRFRDAFVRVFSHLPAQPTRDQKFSLTYVAPEDYSKFLRDGLALTLLIIATMHEVGGLHMSDKSPQQYVDEILSALPSWGKSHRTLVGLAEQTAAVAEAAPAPFLTALESMLEGAPSEAKALFSAEETSIFGPSSPHIQVLWALETLAWDANYLVRVCLVLAGLAEIDPGTESKSLNRPLNSLRSILLSWSPNTYAPLAQRVACLDAVLDRYPNTGWALLVKLMPTGHDTSSPNPKPKLRDVAPMLQEELTFGVVWDSEREIASRLMAAASKDEARVALLVKGFASFRPEVREAFAAYFDAYLAEPQKPEGSIVWHDLNAEVSRHAYFTDSEWAIQEEERTALTALLERHRPTDPLVAERILFDDWLPHIGTYDANTNPIDPENYRRDALNRVLQRDGVPGLLRLTRMVNIPTSVGPVLEFTEISKEQLLELLTVASQDATLPGNLAFYASAVGAQRHGEDWRTEFKARVTDSGLTDETKGHLLLGWPLTFETWEYVRALGDGIYTEYWRLMHTLPLNGKTEEVLFAIGEFRRQGRSLEVIGLVHRRIRDLPTELIMVLLVEGQQQLASGKISMGTMLSYYLNLAFTELVSRKDAKEEDIARLEYIYLPLIRSESRPLTINKFLKQDAKFYVEVLSHAFAGDDVPQDYKPSDNERARAHVSYGLLDSFKDIPGLDDGKIDASSLKQWVDQARAVAQERGLLRVADKHIGHLLASAPISPTEGFWPPSPVCTLIESVASADLESGFCLRRYNLRGVYSKQMYEGGEEERELAALFTKWATATTRYPRTSKALSLIAGWWQRDGDQQDLNAELNKMKH